MDDWTPTHAHNRRAWDRLVRQRQVFARPARNDEFRDPLRTLDGLNWLGGDIRGCRLLCLAAGGGRQSALYAAAGAHVTVVDLSPAMLELDRQVAAQRKLDIRTVEASMDHLPMFNDGQFDVVIHPVSTCYVPEVIRVYREVARVTQAGGLYISQHKQPASLQAPATPSGDGYVLNQPYYRSGPLPEVRGTRLREEGTLEFLHRWEQLLGGMCRNGFVIEDLVEPDHADPQAERGSFAHRAGYLPPYVRIKARRRQPPSSPGQKTLWVPE